MLIYESFILQTRSCRHSWQGVGLLSIKSFVGGPVRYDLGRGAFLVDDAAYLVLNHGQEYQITIDAASEVAACCVFFAAGFAADVQRSLSQDANRPLADPAGNGTDVPLSVQRTYAHDRWVSPVLDELHSAHPLQRDEPGWCDEQLHRLMVGLLLAGEHTRREFAAVAALRPATREKLYRRLHLARDYIAVSYAQPVTLDAIAAVACMSPNHLLRTFKQLLEQSPHQFLTAERLRHARRLLLTTQLPVTDTCLEVGFSSLGSFSWLFRRRFGMGPHAVRTLPLDGSAHGEQALPLARLLARRAGVLLHLAHVHGAATASPIVVEGLPVIDAQLRSLGRAHEQAYLDRVRAGVSSGSRQQVAAAVFDSLDAATADIAIAHTLAAHIAASRVDLVVLATNARGRAARFWLGSVTGALLRAAAAPVLALRPDRRGPVPDPGLLHHIVIPLEGSLRAESILEPALALGRVLQAEFTLLAVITPTAHSAALIDRPAMKLRGHAESSRYLERVAWRLRAAGVTVHTRVATHEHPAAAILIGPPAHQHAGWCLLRDRLSGRHHRQSQADRGTAAGRLLDPDSSAVGFDQGLADRQPQPRPAGVTGARAIDLVEVCENPLMLGHRDARPLIDHADQHILRRRPQSDGEQAAGWRELPRVVEEIMQHLLDPPRVDEDLRQLRLAIQLHAQVAQGLAELA